MNFNAGFPKLISEPLEGGGRVSLDVPDAGTVLLQITTGRDFQPATSYAVVRENWPAPQFGLVKDDDDVFIITTPSLRIRFTADPFTLRIESSYGQVLFETTADGLQIKGREIHLSRKLAEGEGVYGLGEHGEILNRNPGRFRIWNKDEAIHHAFRQYYCTIPFGISLPGGATEPHGFFVDNPGELVFDIGRDNREILRIETRTGDLRLWLFFEETPSQIVAAYTQLTGRMARPPLWALGYQQCRWSYPTADRVREVAREFRTRRIPCDVIYMDIDYMHDFAVFTWNPKSFPDPVGLLTELRNDGFSPLCIIDPGVAIRKGYHVYDEGLATPGFFLRNGNGDLITERVWPGDVHMPDFTLPQARTLWGKWQYDALLKIGIAGVWNDMNEPAIFATTTITREFPPDAVHHDEGQFRTHREIHNIFGMTMAQASCEGQLAHLPNLRPFTLTRSGWAGVQRYSAVWTGDNRSAFTCMPPDIALNLNMGMSGVAFVGCDIGGFGDSATPELFARWMEWGVFQPFCRGHSVTWSVDQEPWSFGPGTEKVVRRMLELRYQLLPYIYTQFVEASEEGTPINRALIFEYPTDATVVSIGDEFLLGPDLLVAPMLEPGKDRRAVYLPPGDWFHFWSATHLEGARWIMAEAPYGQPPVYVKAGAIIPMHPIRQHTKEAGPEVTFLNVWPGARLEGRLIEDDGQTTNYQQGEEARILFTGAATASGLSLTIGAPQGRFRSARREWTVRLHDARRRVAGVTANGQPIPFEIIGNTTQWTTPDTRQAMTFEVVHVAG